MFAKCCETKCRNQLGKGETRVQPIYIIHGTCIDYMRRLIIIDQPESLGRFEEMLVEATDPRFFATGP